MGLCSSEERKPQRNGDKREGAFKREYYVPEERQGNKCTDQDTIRKEVYEVFDKYDLNGDGVLERSEVQKMLADMHENKGREVQWAKLQRYVDSFMVRAGGQQNGRISRNQFYQFYKSKV